MTDAPWYLHVLALGIDPAWRRLPAEQRAYIRKLALAPLSPQSAIILVPGGGAPSRVDEEATAFDMRTAPWSVHYLCSWTDPADNEKNIARVKEIASVLKPWATGRAKAGEDAAAQGQMGP